jgi:hypothetical protein
LLVSSEPLFNENQIKASLLTPVDADGAEKTAAGSLIGSVRDLLQGSAKDAHQQRERAQTNDMLAEVAADTFAMMPGVSWLKAGTVRAAVLLNPKEDLQSNAMTFGMNFTEGVALNRLSKYAGKMLHDPTAPRTLLTESVGLFKFGAGMGAVKAVFDENTWKDQQGSFSFGDGLSNVAKASTIGGAIGVPAGMVGTRIAKLGLEHFGQGGLSPRAMSIGLGALSGYPAGAVFGGVDAVMHGGTAADVWKQAHQGGVMGVFAGGLAGGMIRLDSVPRTTAGGERNAGTTSELIVRASESGERAFSKTDRPPVRMYDLFDSVEMKHAGTLEGNLAALGEYKPGKLRLFQAVANADDVAKAAATEADFINMGRRVNTVESRVYNFKGVQLEIPEAYAATLDEVYQLRITQAQGFAPDATPTQKLAGSMARGKLQGHAYADRAHPADLFAISELADRSLIKRIVMNDHNYYLDAWTRKTYKPDFVTAATAGTDGTMAFYKAIYNHDLNRIVHHEWAHLLANNAVRDAKAFEAAAALEEHSHVDRKRPGYSISEYAKRNVDENWAEHGAGLTKADPTDFFEVSSEAPIRTAVYGKALSKALAYAPADQRSPFQTQLGERVRYINDSVLPRAQDLLEGYLLKGTAQEQIHAARLLRELGDKKHFELLKKVARTSRNDEVATVAFNAAREMAFYGRERWTGYNTAHGTASDDTFINFLVEMAQPQSGVRNAALQYLHPYNTNKAEGYYNLYTYEQHRHPGDQMRMLIEAMKKIPDTQGREQAWEAARRLAGDDPLRKFGVALSVYQRVPSLRTEALRQMIRLDVEKVEHLMRDIVRKPTSPQYQVAKEGLQTLETHLMFKGLETDVKSTNQQTRERAIRNLGETGDRRALPSLLNRFAFGETSVERGLAYQMLKDHFNHQVVKAEARELMRRDSRWYQYLRPILERRADGVVLDVKT